MAPLRIDFLRRRPSASLLGWALMLVGLAGVGLVTLDWAQANQELQAAQARAERQSRIAKAPSRGTTPSLSPTSDTTNARIGTAVAHPWGRLLKELENLADPGIALLGLDAQGASRQLRLTGEARTMAEVIAYVESLRLSPLSRSAVLGSHEWVTHDGLMVVRFSVDMAWGGAL